MRRGDWKLIEFLEDNSFELYNLEHDPAETSNAAREQPQIAQELRAALAKWRAKVRAQMPRPNPNYDPGRATELAKGKQKSDS
jgi:hypothetical protein